MVLIRSSTGLLASNKIETFAAVFKFISKTEKKNILIYLIEG